MVGQGIATSRKGDIVRSGKIPYRLYRVYGVSQQSLFKIRSSKLRRKENVLVHSTICLSFYPLYFE